MSDYTPYHAQPTPENVARLRGEFWPVVEEMLAAAFALLLPYLRGGLPRAVLADIKAKLKPAEAFARRVFLLQAMEDAIAPRPRVEAAPAETGESKSPRHSAKRDPYMFKLTEPWPNLLPAYDNDVFDADWATAAFAGVLASDRTLFALFKRMKALDAALKNPDRHIARMRRWMARRAELEIGRKTPLALGPPPGWHRKRREEPVMRALSLLHQFWRIRKNPP